MPSARSRVDMRDCLGVAVRELQYAIKARHSVSRELVTQCKAVADIGAEGGLADAAGHARDANAKATRAFKDAFGLSPKDVQILADQSREQEVQLLVSPEPLQYLRPITRD